MKILATLALLGLACCATQPATPPEPPFIMQDAVRELGPGFVRDPNTQSIHRLTPGDIEYLGAFRLPIAFSGGAKEYYRYGDGDRGSLFCTGHLVNMDPQLYEVTIPLPKITGDFSELYTAEILQAGNPMPPGTSADLKLKDVELLWHGPSQRLHLVYAKHYQYTDSPCRATSRIVLNDSQTLGPWYLDRPAIESNVYLFTIPEWFAYQYTLGRRLACGRHRDGQGPSGPTIYAYGWPNPLDPPAANTMLGSTTLLRYDDLACWEDGAGDHCIVDHCPEDTYRGGAFLDDGRRRAVVFGRRKGIGRCWYGYPDGTTCPPVCDCGDCGGSRGFQADDYRPELVFFNPMDLAAVATGDWPSWKPQPYAVVDLSPFWFNGGVEVSAVAYAENTDVPPGDPHSGWLFVSQEKALETSSAAYTAVHVFRVAP